MTNLEQITIIAFAAYRVSYLLVYENAPGDVLKHARAWLSKHGFGGLVTCIYCMSFWVALACGWLWVIVPEVVAALAVWGVVKAVYDLSNK